MVAIHRVAGECPSCIPRSAPTIPVQKVHIEVVARNQYMAGDMRDPTACSLFYFALGKAKLVLGLWRQAAWHKEQAQMLKFLNNDFTQPRWRTAALKNAFALLSKRRFGKHLLSAEVTGLTVPWQLCCEQNMLLHSSCSEEV